MASRDTRNAAASPDAADLADFGYKSELDRRLGGLSTFAASFALISIIVGLFTVYGIGYAFAGPLVAWTVLAVLGGQLLVALVFAELAANYPISGSIYQWSKRLSSRRWGWMTGWTYVAAWLVVLPSIAVGLQATLTTLSPKFQLIGDKVPGLLDPAFAQNAIILGLVLFAITTAVNYLGVRYLAAAAKLGLLVEALGIAFLLILLLTHIKRGPGVLFHDQLQLGKGHSWGLFGALLIGAFLPLYQLFGFDEATQLAEETRQPRKIGPQSLLRSIVTAGLLSFLISCLVPMAIPKVADDQVAAGGLQYVIDSLTSGTIGKLFLADVAIAFVCAGIAAHALCARMFFSMARDGGTLFAKKLSYVSPTRHVPTYATAIPALFWTAILLINLGNAKFFNAIIGAGVLLIYLAYLGVTVPALRARMRGDWVPDRRFFHMSPGVGTAVGFGAVVWGALGALNLIWPRAEFYGDAWYQEYSGIFVAALVLVLGAAHYALAFRRGRLEVLPEHRVATSPDTTPTPTV
jgi:urea carboxylase system permease